MLGRLPWRWQAGRQGTGYHKLLLFQAALGLLGIDCYLLYYPEHSWVESHKDPVVGANHYRANLVLKSPHSGSFWMLGEPIFHKGRLTIFRPDLCWHGVGLVEGTRWVLSVGLAVPGKIQACP